MIVILFRKQIQSSFVSVEENNNYNNDYIEYVEILTCGQDTKTLEEQDAMLITAKYKYLIK